MSFEQITFTPAGETYSVLDLQQAEGYLAGSSPNELISWHEEDEPTFEVMRTGAEEINGTFLPLFYSEGQLLKRNYGRKSRTIK